MQIFFLLSALLQWAVAGRIPSNVDPDDFMDHIGQRSFSQKFDPGSTPKSRVIGTREDLGNGIENSDFGADFDGGRGIVLSNRYYYVVGRSNNGSNNDFAIARYFLDGSLDTSFNTSGKVRHSFGGGDDIAHAVAVDTAGRILVVGRSDSGVAGAFDFAILRLKTNGALDTTFHTNGKAVTDGAGGADFARAVVVDANNSSKIVLAGYGKNGSSYNFLTVRYLTNGSLDTAFFTSGKKFTAVGGSDSGALGMTIEHAVNNDKYVIVGNTYNGSNWDMAAIRISVLNPAVMDTSFKTIGIASYDFNNQDDVAYSVTMTTSTPITLVGSTNNGTNLDFAVLRLRDSGLLDTAFKTTGKVTQVIGNNDDGAFAAAYNTSSNLIYAAGYSNNATNNDFAVARFKSNGTLDTSFSTSGKFTKAIGAGEDTAQALYLWNEEPLLVAGRTYNGADYDFALMRLQFDGSLAGSGAPVKHFGTNGLATVDCSGGNFAETPYGVVANAQGTLYLAESLDTNGGGNMQYGVCAVYPDGTKGSVYSTGSRGRPSQEALASISLTSSGIPLVCGSTDIQDASTLFAVRSDLAGIPVGFNSGSPFDITTGGTPDQCLGVFEHSDGEYGAVGLSDTARAPNASFYKVATSGAWRPAFDADGHLTISSNGPFVTGGGVSSINDRMISVVNEPSTFSTQTTAVLGADGTLDTTFNSTGILYGVLCPNKDGFSNGHVVESGPDGALFIAMDNLGGAVPNYLLKVTSDGVVDTSFYSNGFGVSAAGGTPAQANNIRLQLNGKAIRTRYDSGSKFGFSRFTTDGRLDTSFATSGEYNPSAGKPTGLTLGPQGFVCASGTDGGTDSLVVCVWE